MDKERIREIISNSKSPLLVTYYRSYDVDLPTIRTLLNDIHNDDVNKLYNYISFNVSNEPEFCSQYNISPPCTELYVNGERKYTFGSFSGFNYIEAMTKNMIDMEDLILCANARTTTTTEPESMVRIRSTIQ